VAAAAPSTCADYGSGSCRGTGTETGAGSGGGNSSVSRAVQLLPVVLGKGAFGRVVEGTYLGQRVAVKLLATDGPWGAPTEAFAESFAQEVAVLSRCRHPNVVRLLAASVEPPRLCLVLELMDASLERMMYGNPDAPPLPLPKASKQLLLLRRAMQARLMPYGDDLLFLMPYTECCISHVP
jgi:hypothetical protein